MCSEKEKTPNGFKLQECCKGNTKNTHILCPNSIFLNCFNQIHYNKRIQSFFCDTWLLCPFSLFLEEQFLTFPYFHDLDIFFRITGQLFSLSLSLGLSNISSPSDADYIILAGMSQNCIFTRWYTMLIVVSGGFNFDHLIKVVPLTGFTTEKLLLICYSVIMLFLGGKILWDYAKILFLTSLSPIAFSIHLYFMHGLIITVMVPCNKFLISSLFLCITWHSIVRKGFLFLFIYSFVEWCQCILTDFYFSQSAMFHIIIK